MRQDSCKIRQKENLHNQGHCLLSVAMETTLSCQTGTWKTCWNGDYFVVTFSPLTPQPPATTITARPPISSGNIGKWLSEIFFGWKNYSLNGDLNPSPRFEFLSFSYVDFMQVTRPNQLKAKCLKAIIYNRLRRQGAWLATSWTTWVRSRSAADWKFFFALSYLWIQSASFKMSIGTFLRCIHLPDGL